MKIVEDTIDKAVEEFPQAAAAVATPFVVILMIGMMTNLIGVQLNIFELIYATMFVSIIIGGAVLIDHFFPRSDAKKE